MEEDLAPVINDYKRSFFIKRFIQTMCCGIKLLVPTSLMNDEDEPMHKRYCSPQQICLPIAQILLFIVPLIVIVPLSLTLSFGVYPHVAIPLVIAGGM